MIVDKAIINYVVEFFKEVRKFWNFMILKKVWDLQLGRMYYLGTYVIESLELT
jgi:hypothetical protein